MLPLQPAVAGNKKMVEERVETLDKINKEAIKQVPKIPADAKIKLEAKGYEIGENFDIQVKRYQIAPVEDRPIELGKSNKTGDDKEKQDGK